MIIHRRMVQFPQTELTAMILLLPERCFMIGAAALHE
jgi:hypothetical protein